MESANLLVIGLFFLGGGVSATSSSFFPIRPCVEHLPHGFFYAEFGSFRLVAETLHRKLGLH